MSVCLWVCLSVCPRGRLRNHMRALCQIFLCLLHMSVARSSSDMFTIGHIVYCREGVFFPNDNAYVSGTTCTIFTKFFVHVVSVAQSSSGMFTIGCITYRLEGVLFPIESALSAGGRGMGVHSVGEVCYLQLPYYGRPA